MMFINHRINTIQQLLDLKPKQGAEIDLRSDVNQPQKLILNHDPWSQGVDFEEWLKLWSIEKDRGLLVLNTKEDSLESRAVALCNKYNVKSFLFLDTAFPTFKNWVMDQKDSRFMARVSSFEPILNLGFFGDTVKWVWADCFQGVPLPAAVFEQLSLQYKICLVSPELQKRPETEIAHFLDAARFCTAICTKFPETWKAYGSKELE